MKTVAITNIDVKVWTKKLVATRELLMFLNTTYNYKTENF